MYAYDYVREHTDVDEYHSVFSQHLFSASHLTKTGRQCAPSADGADISHCFLYRKGHGSYTRCSMRWTSSSRQVENVIIEQER